MESVGPSPKSIEDLIAQNEVPNLDDDGTLNLSYCNLESLDGLQKIPHQQEILNLDLSCNLLRSLPPSLFPNLTSLDISNNNRIDSLPREMLDGLLLLKYFHASNIQIKEIPPHFFDSLPRLALIDLSRNQLTRLEPTLLHQATNLRSLSLCMNNISDLHPQMLTSLTRLKYLDMSHNQLSDLPQEFCSGLTNLHELDISNNNLAVIHDESFNSLGQLTKMNVACNQLASLPAEIFVPCSNLAEVNLGHNQLCVLPSSITTLGKLFSLNLRGNPSCLFDDQLAKGIKNKKIFMGNAQDVYDDEDSASSVSTLIKELLAADRFHEVYYENLEKPGTFAINLSHRGLTNLNDLDQLVPLPECVTIIHAANNYLREIPCSVLNKFSRLRRIDLRNNLISSLAQQGTQDPVYLRLPKLLTLILNDNLITTVPSNAFNWLPDICILRLDNNPIRCIEDRAFSPLVHLTKCYLNNTQLCGVPSHLFASEDTRLRMLEYLDLSGNALGPRTNYVFPSRSTVRYYPQKPQPLQTSAAQIALSRWTEMVPRAKLKLAFSLPPHSIDNIASHEMRCYLYLCTYLKICAHAFQALAQSKNHDTDLEQSARFTWERTLKFVHQLHWNEGLELFFDHFASNAMHQQLLNSLCAHRLQQFESIDLMKIAKILMCTQTALRNKIIDAADPKMSLEIARSLTVYHEYKKLQQNWKRWAKKTLESMFSKVAIEDAKEKVTVAKAEWEQTIEDFKEKFSSWSPEMQITFNTYLSKPNKIKLKTILINHGIQFEELN